MKETAMSNPTELHVRSVLERLVCERLAITPEQLTAEASFVRDLGADSLDMVDLLLELEVELQLQIPEAELPKMSTVGAAVSFLSERLEARELAAGEKVALPQTVAEGNG
jgi:acyl carrier protein